MKSLSICSHCAKALRSRPKAEVSIPFYRIESRLLSTAAVRLQQEPVQKPPTIEGQPVYAPPTIAPPLTSNVTGPPPPEPSTNKTRPKQSIPDVSVSRMQQQISASLTKPDLATQLAQKLRKTARATTETYITYGLTESYFNSCETQAAYMIPEDQRMRMMTGKGPPKTAGGEDLGIPDKHSEDSWWFRDLGLSPTFSTWSQVTFLHMYILTVRLRDLESTTSFQNYQRYLLEHFSHGAEDKMALYHNMSARGIRNRYLKDLFLQWRGILAAYDEGLVQGDAILGAAVWRNLWKAEEEVDWTKVALVVAYLRKAISLLGRIEISEISGSLDGPQGLWQLSRAGLTDLVSKPSQGSSE